MGRGKAKFFGRVTPDAKALYYISDQVDSVKAIVDDRGNLVSRTEFLPYGETWVEDGDGSLAPKYNSQEMDKETGFYFYNAISSLHLKWQFIII